MRLRRGFSWAAFLALCLSWMLVPAASRARVTSSSEQVQVETVLSQEALRPGDTAGVAVLIRVAPGWHVNSHVPSSEGLIPTDVSVRGVPPDLSLSGWRYPEGHPRAFSFSPEPIEVYEGQVVVRGRIEASSRALVTSHFLKGGVRVQACNDRICLRPGTAEFEMEVNLVPSGTPVATLNPEIFTAEPEPEARPVPEREQAPPEAAGSAQQDRVAGLVERFGALSFAIFFVWGLGLCLTPCVFPMIPITAGFFANQASGSRGKALLLAVLYVEGLALVYGILGTVAGMTGRMLGVALQNPWVVLSVASVLVLLSLSMFGLYEFRIPGLESGARGRAGYVGSFAMGAVLGVVAAPCIGPFSVALLAYVGQRGEPLFGFWAFFAMAQGLGLPFLLLAVFTELSLPRGGEWMIWVKKVFGIIILDLALYFVSPLLPSSIRAWVFLSYAVLGAAYLAFLEPTGMHLPRFRAVKAATGIALVAFALLFAKFFFAPTFALDWQPFTEQALIADGRQGRPAVVDFYADWCIPCKELEHHTLADPRVVQALDGFSLYKADMTRKSPSVRLWQERYRIPGVPTVLFFDSAGRERVRLQEVVGPEDLLRRLAGAALIPESDLAEGSGPPAPGG